MRNLLSTHLLRLRKDVLFWLALAVCLVSGVVFSVSFGKTPAFDDFYFFPLSIALCVLVSFFLGREYRDGTLRSKLIAGYRRGQLYGAGLLVVVGSTLLCLLLFFLPLVVLNYQTLAALGTEILLPVLAGVVLLTVALAAILTAVGFSVPSLAAGAIVSLALWLVTMLGAYQIEFALVQPEYVQEITVTAKGEKIRGPKTPNPNYLGGPLRPVFQVLELCLPNGQLNYYVSYLTSCLYQQEHFDLDPEVEESAFLSQAPVCSLAVTAGASALGLAVFRRKDLK